MKSLIMKLILLGINLGSFGIRYGGTTVIINPGNMLTTFVQTTSVSAGWTPHAAMDVETQPPPCVGSSASTFLIA